MYDINRHSNKLSLILREWLFAMDYRNEPTIHFFFIAGVDYTTTSRTLTFQPTETSQIVMVPILNDAITESLESFTATLSLPLGSMGVALGASTATVSIRDDDRE